MTIAWPLPQATPLQMRASESQDKRPPIIKTRILPRRKPSGHSKIAVFDNISGRRAFSRLAGVPVPGFAPRGPACARCPRLLLIVPKESVPKESSASANSANLPPDLSFEAALAELDKIVAAMEAGELPLEDSLKAYQRGVALVKAAHARLASAEQQVKILEEGVLKPLAPDEGDE